MRRLFKIIGISLLGCSWPAAAAELTEIEVEYENDRYLLTSRTEFDASQAALYHVLTDYDLFIHFNSTFKKTENRPADDDGRPGFYTRMDGCVLIFCKSYIRAGYLDLKPEYDIVATIDPEQSNFRYARERWHLIPYGDKTVLLYEFEMEPDFWVPPYLGPFVVKKALKSGGARAVRNIEVLAQKRMLATNE